MASTIWRGAITFNGHSLNVALYNKKKSRSSDSFKTLGSDGKPVRQVLVETDEYEKLVEDPTIKVATIGRNDTSKGILVGKDQYEALPQEAVEAITGANKSTVIDPDTFVPLDAIPLELANMAVAVVPDDKVIGAEGDVNTVWNGLRESGYAYVTQITTRAGSRDSILVLYADDDGFHGVTLPFEAEMNTIPSFDYTADEAQAQAVAAAITESELVEDTFVHGDYDSTYRSVRDDAIEKVLAGVKIEAPKAAPKKSAGPSLMDTLSKSVDAAKAKPKAKKASAKKAKVKA